MQILEELYTVKIFTLPLEETPPAKHTSGTRNHILKSIRATNVGGTMKNAELLSGDVNTKYHESNAVISADGKRMYFDRNDYFEGDYDKSENGINQINLYYAEKIDGKGWSGVVSVPFNNNEYSTGHPALSQDGKTLYTL